MIKDKVYTYEYPHPAITTDCVIFGFNDDKLQVLLVNRGLEPYKGYWALPGGFLNMDETAEKGAARELNEETGISDAFIEQFYTFTEPNRDPRERVVSIAFYALTKIQEVKGGDDASDAKWFPIDCLPDLAFDHSIIISEAVKRLQERIHFHPVGFELLPEKFTMHELQSLYESILDVKFDRRNFVNKMKRLNLLIELDETSWPTPMREAKLYSFNKESYSDLKQNGFKTEF